MSDDALVALYANGNDSAFDLLLNRHKNALFSYILSFLHDKNLADDVFQDTFVKAITTIRQGRYTQNGKFKAWIMRIAHNLIMDYFRQERNENTLSNDDEPNILNNLKLSEATCEDQLVHLQILDDVKKLIQHLPPNQREVLEMRYYQNLSFKQIAQLTGVSINTALGRMRYALINIRRMATHNHMELSPS